MRPIQQILDEYDHEYEKYKNIESTDRYITRINYLIKDAIRELRPCYPGTDNYNHAEIYPDEVIKPDDSDKDRFKKLYDLWYQAPYDYEIPNGDKVRINRILDQNFILPQYLEVVQKSREAEHQWKIDQERLFREYDEHPDLDMDEILEEYLDTLSHRYDGEYGGYPIHPLVQMFVEQKCSIRLIRK